MTLLISSTIKECKHWRDGTQRFCPCARLKINGKSCRSLGTALRQELVIWFFCLWNLWRTRRVSGHLIEICIPSDTKPTWTSRTAEQLHVVFAPNQHIMSSSEPWSSHDEQADVVLLSLPSGLLSASRTMPLDVHVSKTHGADLDVLGANL